MIPFDKIYPNSYIKLSDNTYFDQSITSISNISVGANFYI